MMSVPFVTMTLMSELPAGDTHDVIRHSGQVVAVVVPIEEYQQLRQAMHEQQVNEEFDAGVVPLRVQLGPPVLRLRGIRAGRAPVAPGRTSHNPPVVGSSPTRSTQSGHIEQLPSRSWRAKVYAGTDPLTGREIRFRKTCKTERAAQIELGKLLAMAQAGRQPDSDATVAQLLDQYVSTAGWDVSTRVSNASAGKAVSGRTVSGAVR